MKKRIEKGMTVTMRHKGVILRGRAIACHGNLTKVSFLNKPVISAHLTVAQ